MLPLLCLMKAVAAVLFAATKVVEKEEQGWGGGVLVKELRCGGQFTMFPRVAHKGSGGVNCVPGYVIGSATSPEWAGV